MLLLNLAQPELQTEAYPQAAMCICVSACFSWLSQPAYTSISQISMSFLRICRQVSAAPRPDRAASGAGSSHPRLRSRAEGSKTLVAGARPPAARRRRVQASHAVALLGVWSGMPPCT